MPGLVIKRDEKYSEKEAEKKRQKDEEARRIRVIAGSPPTEAKYYKAFVEWKVASEDEVKKKNTPDWDAYAARGDVLGKVPDGSSWALAPVALRQPPQPVVGASFPQGQSLPPLTTPTATQYFS